MKSLFLCIGIALAGTPLCNDELMTKYTSICSAYTGAFNCSQKASMGCVWCNYEPSYICGGTRKVKESCEYAPPEPCFVDQPCSTKIVGSTPGGTVRSFFAPQKCYTACMTFNSTFPVNPQKACKSGLPRKVVIAISISVIIGVAILMGLLIWLWCRARKGKLIVQGPIPAPAQRAPTLSRHVHSDQSRPPLQEKRASSTRRRDSDDGYHHVAPTYHASSTNHVSNTIHYGMASAYVTSSGDGGGNYGGGGGGGGGAGNYATADYGGANYATADYGGGGGGGDGGANYGSAAADYGGGGGGGGGGGYGGGGAE